MRFRGLIKRYAVDTLIPFLNLKAPGSHWNAVLYPVFRKVVNWLIPGLSYKLVKLTICKISIKYLAYAVVKLCLTNTIGPLLRDIKQMPRRVWICLRLYLGLNY